MSRWACCQDPPLKGPSLALGMTTEAALGTTTSAAPPMFTPFRLREMTLENRIVVAPMDMYSATDGVPGDWQLFAVAST